MPIIIQLELLNLSLCFPVPQLRQFWTVLDENCVVEFSSFCTIESSVWWSDLALF